MICGRDRGRIGGEIWTGKEIEIEGFWGRGGNGGGTIRRIEAAKRMALSDYDSWVAGARPEVNRPIFF